MLNFQKVFDFLKGNISDSTTPANNTGETNPLIHTLQNMGNFASKVFPSRTITVNNSVEQNNPQNKQTFSEPEMKRLIYAESTNNPEAVSPTGAIGLTQMTKLAWQDVNDLRKKQNLPTYSFKQASNPTVSKEYGSTYLNTRIPQILQAHYPNIPINQITMLLYYNNRLNEYMKANGDLSKLSTEAKRYLNKILNLNLK